jgi:hypothetical protein
MRSAATVIALAAALVLGALSDLHVYWALGGGWGGAAAIPTRPGGPPLFAPSGAGTLAVAAALAVAAYLVLVRGGLARPVGPALLYAAGAWGLDLVFVACAVGDFRYVGLFKRVRGTPFAVRDDWLHVPLCAALGVAALYLALQRPAGSAPPPSGQAAAHEAAK